MILYVPVLYLITQDHVNKLYNCEGTESTERVDDVRDEIINHWLGNFGSRLRLIVGSIRYLVQQNVKRRIMLAIIIIKIVLCGSHATVITACC